MKESIKQAEDVLNVGGTPILDLKYNAIMVLAQSATTMLLQQTMRQKQQA